MPMFICFIFVLDTSVSHSVFPLMANPLHHGASNDVYINKIISTSEKRSAADYIKPLVA